MILRSPDKTQRRERADDEYSYPKPERPRRRGVPVRLDGRDDGFDARLRQPEPAVPPVFGPQMKEAAPVRAFESVGVDRLHHCDALLHSRDPVG